MLCTLQRSSVTRAGQSEQALRSAFEGKFVVVKMDMPATHKGVDVHPDRDPDIDFSPNDDSRPDRASTSGCAKRA